MTSPTFERRRLHFTTLREALAEAEELARHPGGVRVTGNWSAGQNLDHLAFWAERPVQGFPFKFPLLLRWLGPLLKKTMLHKPMQPGFRWKGEIARQATPQSDVSLEAGLARYQQAVADFERGPLAPRSPAFGPMTRDDWTQLQCRHAELHLSFIHKL